jgi:hypothetical protein
MNANKNVFYEQQLLAMKLANIFNENVRKILNSAKKFKSVFPSTEKIYDKQIVQDNDPSIKNRAKRFNSEDNNNNINNKYYNKYNSKLKKRYADDFNYNNNNNDYNSYNDYNGDYSNEKNEYEYILVRDNKRSIYNKKKNYNQEKVNHKKDQGIGNKTLAFNLVIPNKSEYDSSNTSRKYKESSTNYNKSANNVEKIENIENSDKNINYCENKSRENSTSHSDDCKNENNSDNNSNSFKNSYDTIKEIKNIYRRRENSRFGFVNNTFKSENNSETIFDNIVPEYVSNIIYKKISSYTFFKKFTCVKDINRDMIYFEKELNKNHDDSWVQFIKSSVTVEGK